MSDDDRTIFRSDNAQGADTVRHIPAIGQVWIDNDPRGGPMFQIIAIEGEYAIVTDMRGKKRRKIQLKRLRPGKRGYSLQIDGSTATSEGGSASE